MILIIVVLSICLMFAGFIIEYLRKERISLKNTVYNFDIERSLFLRTLDSIRYLYKETASDNLTDEEIKLIIKKFETNIVKVIEGRLHIDNALIKFETIKEFQETLEENSKNKKIELIITDGEGCVHG